MPAHLGSILLKLPDAKVAHCDLSSVYSHQIDQIVAAANDGEEQALENTQRKIDLGSFRPFQELSVDDRRKLLNLADLIEVEPEQILVEDSQLQSDFYLILKGAVGFFKSEGDERQLLFQRYHGDYLGELGLFDDVERPVTIIALEPSELVRISLANLQIFLKKNPELTRQLEIRAANAAVALDLGRRREVRIRIHRQVILKLEDGRSFPATLENLSPGGLPLTKVPPSWQERELVEFGVELPQGILELRGRIVWRRKNEVGVSLTRDNPDHDMLMHRVIRSLVERGR